MDRLKRYINCHVPITTCTLRCPYCYITQHRLFDGPLPTYQYSPQHVRKALSRERMGGICLINICAGGETLLDSRLLEYVRELLEEGHYIMLVTNGTITKRFDEIIQFPEELRRHIFFKFSYHYLEFKRRNLFDVFFSNIRKVRDAGCSFTLEITPSDDAVQYIDDIKAKALKELGALCHVTIARDEKDDSELPMMTHLSREEYIKTWGTFDSALFDYKLTIFGEKRNEFCYAGDWTFYLNLATGMMKQCYKSLYDQNIFEDPSKPINFKSIGCNCITHHCYNGHSFIVLGSIPSLQSPTYADERNRICQDGSEWLQPEMKAIMLQKTSENNTEYSFIKKLAINTEMYCRKNDLSLKHPIYSLKRAVYLAIHNHN